MKTLSIFLLLFFFVSMFFALILYRVFSTTDYQEYTVTVNINNETKIAIKENNVSIVYEFIHSSERTPWIEIWSVNQTGFYVRKICWRSGGAGHPSNPEDFMGNVKIVVEDGYYCAVGVDRFIGRRVVVDLGHAINASITIGNYTIKPPKPNSHYIVVLEVIDHNIRSEPFTGLHIYSPSNTILFQKRSHFF